MKLVRYGRSGAEKPGLLDANGKIRSLAGKVDDIGPDTLTPRGLNKLRRLNPARLPLVGGRPRFGPPIADIGKLVCIGLNYKEHARETGNPLPQEPIIFQKAITSLTGPDGPVVLPKGSKKLDWEVELCIVIGTKAQYVTRRDALNYVAGYCVGNDVSEREMQLERGGQWTKGKSGDSFAPLGPWLVTADAVPNPQRLGLWLAVNGDMQQSSSTRDMIFDVRQLISYTSRCMTLMPGDVIMTGTPPGVGAGQKPPRFLKAGDTVTLGIDGLGEQRQKVVTWNNRPKR